MNKIVIGGFGRSGTSITLHLLSNCSEVYAVPFETKFLVETFGIFSLLKKTRDIIIPTDKNFDLEFLKSILQNHEKSSSKYIQICNELGSHVYNYKNLIDEFDNYSEIKDLFFVNFSKNYKSFNYTNNLILIRKLIDDLFEEKTKSLIRSFL